MNNTITHSGVIEQIYQNRISVRIEQVSACAACKAAGHCNASDRKEKLIEVYCARPSDYRVGESVVITADEHVGHRAVVWGFGLPLLILLASIFGLKVLTRSDGMAALIGILSLIPYYILLYLLRRKIRDQLAFKLQPSGTMKQQTTNKHNN